MKIISISGLDGSGKSTQIELLKSYLKSQGKKFFYFHAIQFSLASILKNQYYKLLHMQRFIVLNNNKETSILKANRLQIIARRIFLFLDLLRFKKLYYRLEKEGYDFLISDRYFYDSVINIEYLKNCHFELVEESNLNNIRSSCLRRLADPQDDIIKPELAIYLKTSPETIMQRERKPDQGIGYLQDKKVFYDEMSPVWNLKIIDGNKNKEEVFTELKKLL